MFKLILLFVMRLLLLEERMSIPFSLVELILLFEIVLLLLSVETKPPWSLKLTLLFVIVLKLAPDNPIPKAFRFASLWSMVL